MIQKLIAELADEPVACIEWAAGIPNSIVEVVLKGDGIGLPIGTKLYARPDPRVSMLEGLLREAFLELRHAKIFTVSREKMHPAGQELYEGLIERIAAALGEG